MMNTTEPRLLVVFADALGLQQMRQHQSDWSFVPHRRALRGVLGYSSGALASLLTGAPQKHHGRMCLFAQRTVAGPGLLRPLSWLDMLPKVIHERNLVRRWAGKAFAYMRGLTGYVALHKVPPTAFRWLDLPEREDLFRAPTIGGQATFLADARSAGVDLFVSPWQLPEKQRWEQALEVLRRRAPRLSFLYATELDGALHHEGNHGRSIAPTSRRISERIERARDALASHGAPVRTLVIGDHGMADITRVIRPPRWLERERRARVFIDSTMLRFWGSEAALRDCRRRLEEDGIPGRWLDVGGLDAREVPTEGSPYGRAIFVLREGCLFAPSFMGGAVRGMHGYDLDATSAKASIASDSALPDDVTKLSDVARVVRADLGLAA
jgi:hypothetical protein